MKVSGVIYQMKRKCPKCKSDKVIPIEYGMPGIELIEMENRGELKLGGCIVMPNNPKWYCKDCGNDWK